MHSIFRSGKYVYKPTMDKMCCPSYTIRCEALKFKPSKSQKKVLRKCTKYLMDDVKPKGEGEENEMDAQEAAGGTHVIRVSFKTCFFFKFHFLFFFKKSML